MNDHGRLFYEHRSDGKTTPIMLTMTRKQLFEGFKVWDGTEKLLLLDTSQVDMNHLDETAHLSFASFRQAYSTNNLDLSVRETIPIPDRFLVEVKPDGQVDTISIKNADAGMITDSADGSITHGGIDLNPGITAMDIEKEKSGFIVPAFDGFEVDNTPIIDQITPVIINISPITDIRPLLGVKQEETEHAPPSIFKSHRI